MLFALAGGAPVAVASPGANDFGIPACGGALAIVVFVVFGAPAMAEGLLGGSFTRLGGSAFTPGGGCFVAGPFPGGGIGSSLSSCLFTSEGSFGGGFFGGVTGNDFARSSNVIPSNPKTPCLCVAVGGIDSAHTTPPPCIHHCIASPEPEPGILDGVFACPLVAGIPPPLAGGETLCRFDAPPSEPAFALRP